MKRQIAFVLLLLAFLGIWIFSGGFPPDPGEAVREPASPPAAEGEPEDGDTLVVAIPSSPDHLNPALYQTADPTQFLIDLIFPGLLDWRFDCALRGEPALAERWEWGEGRREATFFLRRDRIWEDGRPVTADDVVFTFDLLADKDVLSPRANHLQKMRPENPVEKLGDYELRFHFLEAYDPAVQLSHMAGLQIVPKHALAEAGRKEIRAHPFQRSPLSAGPFRLERWTEGQELVLVPNEKSFGRRVAHLDRVVFRILRDYNTRLTELLSGGVDLVYGLQPEDLARAASHPELRVLPRGYRWIDYVAWNFRNPLFESIQVRKALAMAVDCEKLIDSVLSYGGKRYGRRAVSLIAPEICGVENSAIRPLPFDPEEAKRLLAEEGWLDRDGDGILDRGEEKFSFRLLVYVESPRLVLVSQAVQEMLRRVGVEVRIDRKDYNRAVEDLKEKNFEAAIVGWQSELWVDPSATLRTDNPFNYGSYSSPRVDDLLDRGLREPDPKAAKQVWDELQAVVYEDQPQLLLYWRDIPVVVHGRFRNAKADVLAPFADLESWWVPRAEQKHRR